MDTTQEETQSTNDIQDEGAEVSPVTPAPSKKPMSARTKAEARRRRILEASAKRMNVVSGEVPSSAPSITDTPSPETEDHVQNDAEDNEGSEAVADDETKESNSTTASEVTRTTSSSRLAQMRRRRFKKEQSATKEDAETTTSSEEKKAKDDDVVSKEEDVTVIETQNVTDEVKSEPIIEADASDIQGSEEKKYMGVARMRRKRLAEKKKREEVEATATDSKNVSIRHKSRTSEKANTLPIFLHLFITLILFSVGVQIGMNQHTHIIWEDGMIVNELSLKESKILSYLLFKKENENVLQSFTIEERTPHVGEDEFSIDEFSTDDSTTQSEKNVDPIFRVDLDELTQNPTFLNKIARIAIRLHRALLATIMFLPQTLLSIPHAIVTTKCYPYFFLISAFLRRGSTLLGATIPSKTEDEDDSNKKDILTMMIAGAKEMIGKVVPGFGILKFLYVMLQEGRDDMMVVSCGLLFGLAFPLLKMGNVGDGHGESVVIGEEL